MSFSTALYISVLYEFSEMNLCLYIQEKAK